jgi:hypothetical protein
MVLLIVMDLQPVFTFAFVLDAGVGRIEFFFFWNPMHVVCCAILFDQTCRM